MKIEGTGAIVTGGSSGIGKAIVAALLERGGKVCIIARDAEKAATVIEEFKTLYKSCTVHFIQCDITNSDQLKDAFERSKELLGCLDIVVNNAAHVGEANWERTIEVNLTALCRGCFLALDMMRKDTGNTGGVVINVSALCVFRPVQFAPVYTATKSAVNGLTRALAARDDFKETQVRFNCVCPGGTQTPLVDPNEIHKENWSEQDYERVVRFFSLSSKTMMRAEEVAEATVDIIEKDSYNGAVLVMTSRGSDFMEPQAVPHLQNVSPH